MGEHKIEFIFVPPSFGIRKPELVTLNNVTRWWKFAKTKIKDEFKAEISEWNLPGWDDNPFTKAEIEYTILRKDGYKLDSDNLAFTYKWLQDVLVENCYLVDDDKIKVVLNPTQLHVEGNVETSVRVTITLMEMNIMTIEELKALIDILQADLENVGEEVHVKAASARVRKALGELKNATAQLRRDLVELDKA
jgi:hypothetical protein